MKSFILLCLSSLLLLLAEALVSTVKNLRPVVPNLIYRSASLDNLSPSDAESLLGGSAFGCKTPISTVIDLRNRDEIEKGRTNRTDGSKQFYSALMDDDRLVHIPILRDVNAFWDEAIDRMDPIERAKATVQTAFQGGALDRAAARNLEKGGLSMLYSVMMATASRPIASALQTCVEASEKGPVLFHCQKGKDRTGVLAMLIQAILGQEESEIVQAYAMSAELLGEEERSDAENNPSDSGGLVDWSYFRGSPESAIEDTLQWTKQRYGSVEAYLDAISFDDRQRSRLRSCFRERHKGLD